jgi:hypothetical protein
MYGASMSPALFHSFTMVGIQSKLRYSVWEVTSDSLPERRLGVAHRLPVFSHLLHKTE